MAFVNLQFSMEDLPAADSIEMEPMADEYRREVLTQQLIIWVPVWLVSFLPLILAQIRFLLAIPVFVLLLAIVIATRVVKMSTVKGIALREHDIAYQSGLHWRKTVMLAFDRVQHVEVNSGPLQRKFGLATLKFFTAGGSSVDLKVDGLAKERAERIRAYVLSKSSAANSL